MRIAIYAQMFEQQFCDSMIVSGVCTPLAQYLFGKNRENSRKAQSARGSFSKLHRPGQLSRKLERLFPTTYRIRENSRKPEGLPESAKVLDKIAENSIDLKRIGENWERIEED